MIAFTAQDIVRIRQRAKEHPEILENIINNTKDVRRKLYIQESGKATWLHYFVCPKHSVKLNFDYDDAAHYRCPVDGEVFTGEPYEGGWWDILLKKNTESCYDLAVVYMITQQKKYLKVVQEILLGYAKNYPNYEVHGEIPYNHPGKFAAQALNDSSALNKLARAYDIVKDTFSTEEQELIEHDLLLEGAKHLKNNFTPQIHNHEVCTNSTLGIIGLLLGNQELVEQAVNEKYGLKYQLDHGVLKDGLWFEGSTAYHYYALLWFLYYEKFARYTEYSLVKEPHYRKILQTMMTYFNSLVQADLSMPLINDGTDAAGFKDKNYIFEYGYAIFPEDEEMLWALSHTNGAKKRNNIEALLYGVDKIPDAEEHIFRHYLAKEGSQLAVLHGDDQRYFLFKALPYGGEHDHYDRLAISFSAFGKKLCSDLGTAKGYGVPLHYAYYKNTATHNTVAINGDNMPPVNTKVNCYRKNGEDDVYLDAQINWIEETRMPDSFVIKQWNDESYQGTVMRRIIQWYGKYFIDVFVVNSPNTLYKDWILHIDGMRLPVAEENGVVHKSISNKNPQRHLHDVTVVEASGMIKNVYDCEDDVYLSVHTLSDGKKMLYGLGPDNPSVRDISYLMERTEEKKTIYINVIEAYRKGTEQIVAVEATVQDATVQITVHESHGEKKKLKITV